MLSGGLCLNFCPMAGRHLLSFWTHVPRLVQLWNKAGLPRPFMRVTSSVLFACKKNRWAADCSSQAGALRFVVVSCPYFQWTHFSKVSKSPLISFCHYCCYGWITELGYSSSDHRCRAVCDAGRADALASPCWPLDSPPSQEHTSSA